MWRAGLVFLTIAGLTQAAWAEDDPVAAIIDGDVIFRSRIEREYKALGPAYQQRSFEQLYPSLVNRHIDRSLLLRAGERQKLLDDPKIQARIEDAVDDVLRKAYLEGRLRELITDEKIQARYQQYLEKNPPSDQVRAREILVETEQEADELLEELRRGADFDVLARSRSKSPAREVGGDLGYFNRGELLKELDAVVFDMRVGATTSQPIKTQFGFHIMELMDRRTIMPQSLAEKRADIVNALSREATQQILNELWAKAEVQRFRMDGTEVEGLRPGQTQGAAKPGTKSQ